MENKEIVQLLPNDKRLKKRRISSLMDSQNHGRPIFGKNTGTASSQPAATATAAKHAAPASTIAKYKYRPEPKLRPKDKALG